MGLETSALSNINLSLIIFIFIPAIVGGIGLIAYNFTSKPANKTSFGSIEDEKTPELRSQ